jgi:hypothetical protein
MADTYVLPEDAWLQVEETEYGPVVVNAFTTAELEQMDREARLRSGICQDLATLPANAHLDMRALAKILKRSTKSIAEAFCNTKETDGEMLKYIFERLVELLQLRKVDEHIALKKSLFAVILQTVSSGDIGGTNGRIAMLLVGPPSVGKSTVARAAMCISPVSELLSANSVTPSGLIGYTESAGKGRTRVIPGKLAIADRGVAIMQDMQNVDTMARRHVFGFFADLAETGRLTRTMNHEVDLEVSTALLLDINPKSTANPSHVAKPSLFLEDVGLPVPLLTRMDVIIPFSFDAERNQEITLGIIDAATSVGPLPNQAESDAARELRVVLAYLRDACPTVQVEISR